MGDQYDMLVRRFAVKHAALYAGLPAPLRRQALCDIWLQKYVFLADPASEGAMATLDGRHCAPPAIGRCTVRFACCRHFRSRIR